MPDRTHEHCEGRFPAELGIRRDGHWGAFLLLMFCLAFLVCVVLPVVIHYGIVVGNYIDRWWKFWLP